MVTFIKYKFLPESDFSQIESPYFSLILEPALMDSSNSPVSKNRVNRINGLITIKPGFKTSPVN